jgi:hypothetical protein
LGGVVVWWGRLALALFDHHQHLNTTAQTLATAGKQLMVLKTKDASLAEGQVGQSVSQWMDELWNPMGRYLCDAPVN